MKKIALSVLLLCLVLIQSLAQVRSDIAWGDQGNGTYINPVLNAV